MIQVVSVGCATINSLFSLENYSLFRGRHFETAHILFPLNLSPTNFSIHWWVLSVAITTVVFHFPRAFCIYYLEFLHKEFICSCVDSQVHTVFFGSEFNATVIYLFVQPLPTWAIGSFSGWTPVPFWYDLILSSVFFLSFLPFEDESPLPKLWTYHVASHGFRKQSQPFWRWPKGFWYTCLLLLHNVPTLGPAKNTRYIQNQGFSWFPCPFGPLPSQFLGQQKSGFLSQSNFLSSGMSD